MPNNQLAEKLRVAVEALADIINPMAKLQREANERGDRLDGVMAYQIAESVSFSRNIARCALEQITGEKQ